MLRNRVINKILSLKIFNNTHTILAYTTHSIMPTHIQVEPTTKCNLNCKICMRSNEVNCDMSLELFKSIIDQLKYPGLLTRSINLTGLGEPLLNPHLVDMVKYASEKKLKVGFTDNFTLMDRNKSFNLIEAGLDSMHVSFDSSSKQKFEEIRGGANFDQVLDNIRIFVRTRRELNSRRPTIMLHSTISRENIGEIQQLISLGESLEVDGIYLRKHIGLDGISFKKIGFNKWDGDINYSPISLELGSLPKSKIKVKSRHSNNIPVSCFATTECFITFDGKVLPCGNLMELIPREQYSKFQFGDLKHDSLEQVWRSSRYKQFRRRIALAGYNPICKGCVVYRHIKRLQ